MRPTLPFPPSGSTKDLARLLSENGRNCSGLPDEVRKCAFELFKPKLDAMEPNEKLDSASLISERLQEAQKCHVEGGRYVFIPAAVGIRDGRLKINQSKLSLLIGGTTTKGNAANFTRLGDEFFPEKEVHIVSVVRWLSDNFRSDDVVIMKMDVEGAEHDIIPALIKSGAHRLVDVLAWECHEKGGPCNFLGKALKDLTDIEILQEGKDYQGWQ